MVKLGFIFDCHAKDVNPRGRKDDYFQSILDKMEYTLALCSYVFIGGDLFDTPISSTLCVNRINMLFSKYEKRGVIIKILEGNHDTLGRNKSLTPTSLGSLVITNPKRLFRTPLSVEGVVITPIIDYEDIPQVTTATYNILLGHALWETPDEFTLSAKDIPEGYDACLLGHDHTAYPMQVINETTKLYRIGSLARKENLEENRIRPVKFLSFDTEDTSFTEVEIPCEEGKYVFVDKILEDDTTTDVELNLEDLKQALKAQDKLSMSYILKYVLHVDDEMIQFIQNIRTTHYKGE